MVRKVILHIGTHKTGSSSIQQSLAGYDDGTCFYARFDENNHSNAIAIAFSRAPHRIQYWAELGLSEDELQDSGAKYLARLDQDLSREDRQVLIISAEVISALDDAEKKDLIEFLQRRADEIEVYCYIRDPLSFAVSAMQQRVKGGEFSVAKKISPKYKDKIQYFKETLPAQNIHVMEFNRDKFPDRCVARHFLQKIQLNVDSSSRIISNESLKTPALKLQAHLNRTNPCRFCDEILHIARRRITKDLNQAYAASDKLDPSRFVDLADFSEADYLQTEFGIKFDRPHQCNLDPQFDTANAWLADMTDVDLDPLRNSLQSAGIRLKSDDPTVMINRLFYHYVAQASYQDARRTLEQRIRSVDAHNKILTTQIEHLQTDAAAHQRTRIWLHRTRAACRNISGLRMLVRMLRNSKEKLQ